jgi:hypothetical protein
MNITDKSLLRKLVWTLALKLALLLALWWVFVRGHGVSIDDGSVAAQLLHPALPAIQGTNK